MALHNIGQAKEEIEALLQGQQLSKVGNVNGALERSARTVVQQADIPEASGVEDITLYGGVFYYPAPSTIYGGALNLLRRQGDASTPWDFNYKTYIDQFTRTKHWQPNGYMIDFEYRNGSGIMGISTPNTNPELIIDPMNEVGNWTVGGSASSLAQDTVNYYQQPASLRFTLTGSSAGYIEETLTNAIDLSTYQNVGVVFLAINTPSTASLTSVVLRLGSDSTNYSEVTQTEGFLGTWIANNWLLVAFDLATATDTGTPDYENIDYVRLTVNHTATITNFRMGTLFTSLGAPHELLFQSSAVFLAQGSSTPSQSITSDGDTVMLNDAAYNLFIYESALTIAVQQGGTLESGYVQMLRGTLYGNGNTDAGLYALYRADNPSEQLRTIGTYYDSNEGYNRYGN